MVGRVAEVVGEIFVTFDWEAEAVVKILVVYQLVETTEMVGWEVDSVREISVLAELVAEVVQAMVVWILRYVETLEIARVCDGLTNMMALEAFC